LQEGSIMILGIIIGFILAFVFLIWLIAQIL
jgi:hypothetical protein